MIIRTAVILLLGLCSTAHVFSAAGNWDGEQLAEVTISVVDDLTSNPVSGAEVWVITGRERDHFRISKECPGALAMPPEALGTRAKTCFDGTLRFATTFESGGSFEIANGKKVYTGSWFIAGHIEVRRIGYKDFVAELSDLVSDKHHDIQEPHLNLTIKLTPLPAPKAPR